jgi:hypothetical protein
MSSSELSLIEWLIHRTPEEYRVLWNSWNLVSNMTRIMRFGEPLCSTQFPSTNFPAVLHFQVPDAPEAL